MQINPTPCNPIQRSGNFIVFKIFRSGLDDFLIDDEFHAALRSQVLVVVFLIIYQASNNFLVLLHIHHLLLLGLCGAKP